MVPHQHGDCYPEFVCGFEYVQAPKRDAQDSLCFHEAIFIGLSDLHPPWFQIFSQNVHSGGIIVADSPFCGE